MISNDKPSDLETLIRDDTIGRTELALLEDRSLPGAVGIVRKLDVLLDQAIARNSAAHKVQAACRPRCDSCCYRAFRSSFLEAAVVADYIRTTFDEKRQASLRTRLNEFSDALLDRPEDQRAALRIACPLLEEGLCSVYEVRPFACRGCNSTDANACRELKDDPSRQVALPTVPAQSSMAKALEEGLAEGVASVRLDYQPVEFGPALRLILDRQETVDAYFSGEIVTRGIRPSTEPSGDMPRAAMADLFDRIYGQGEVIDEIGDLPSAHPVYRLLRMKGPRAHASEQEITESRERWVAALRDVKSREYDPRDLFEALRWHTTFEVAYHGRNDLPLMAEQGDFLCEITSRALPDLAEELPRNGDSGKLRVGYISYNLRNSNGANWALGWLDGHGADVETYAFNLHESEDEYSMAWKSAANHYYHLPLNVPKSARFIKSLKLDALIYTDIGMSGRNYQFATMRLAPVQCTAWGHPITSGLPTIDYYLSSELMEPPNAQEHYREKLVLLPGSGLRYRRISDTPTQMSKAHFGLGQGPLYLMAQNIMKCLPKADDLFRRICERTGEPIVLINGLNPPETQILRRRLAAAGVKTVWIQFRPRPDYLRLLGLCEVSLDPPEWSGGNSTLDALYLGAPVVTLPGTFMRGRHSMAFLEQAGAPGLIAKDEDDYVDLATNRDRRQDAMRQMDVNALFEDERPVAALDEFLWRVCRT